jgi:hypothetical protein
MMPLTTNL